MSSGFAGNPFMQKVSTGNLNVIGIKLIGPNGEEVTISLDKHCFINPGDKLEIIMPALFFVSAPKENKPAEPIWSKDLPKKSGWYVGTNQEAITYTTTHRVMSGPKKGAYKYQDRVMQPNQMFPIRIDISSTVKPARLSINFFNLMSPQIRLPTISQPYSIGKEMWETSKLYKSIVIRQVPLVPDVQDMTQALSKAIAPALKTIEEDDDILL